MAQYLELITPITSTTTMVVFSIFEVEFYVKDNNMFGADLIGVATVSARRILSGETISEWLPITQLTWQAFKTGHITPTRNKVHEMRGQSDIPVQHHDRSGPFQSPKLLLPGSERRVGHALPRHTRAKVAVAGVACG